MLTVCMSAFIGAGGATAFAYEGEQEPVAECTHEYTEEVVEGTCTTKGYTKYTCNLCGDTYTDNYTEVNGHKFGEIVIEPTRKFQGKFSSSLAARAELFYALRKMSDEDYHAGRRVTVNCLYREGYELVYKTASYRIGGKPRPERSWEVMSTEIAEAIKRA